MVPEQRVRDLASRMWGGEHLLGRHRIFDTWIDEQIDALAHEPLGEGE
jgi:hypothetical protein